MKQIIEGPDGDIDRIIRSVRENGDAVTNILVKEFPSRADQKLAADTVAAIEDAFGLYDTTGVCNGFTLRRNGGV